SGPAELPVDADQVRRDPVPVVVRLHGRPPGGAHTSTEPLVAEQPDGRGGERGRILGLHEKPGLAIAYRFGNPTGAAADHRQPTRRRLDDGYPESLHEQIVAARGQHEQVGGIIERRKRVGVVPNATTRTSAASARHPRNSSTERARSAVQWLFAATTEHRSRIWRAVQRLNTERRIFASSSRKSAPCAMIPNGGPPRACSQVAA